MKNMQLRLIKSSITGSKVQKGMAFITILLATVLIACMLNITLKIGDQIASELRGYGSNIVVLPKGEALAIEIEGKNFTPLKSQNYLNEEDLHKIKEIFWRNNVVAFAPFLNGEVKDASGEKYQINRDRGSQQDQRQRNHVQSPHLRHLQTDLAHHKASAPPVRSMKTSSKDCWRRRTS